MSQRLTKEQFIGKAKAVHGDKYDYSKVEYINNSTNVCIICLVHGEFWQRPDKHLIGHGCPYCSKTKKKTKEDFIKQAREIHGDKYDYSKVEYINNDTKVCIICHEKDENGIEHGEFWQTPHSHLKNRGCPKCGLKKMGRPIPYEEFIEKAKIIHGDKYTYPIKEQYINISTKIPILCKEHGEFWQRPYAHLGGSSCPKCSAIQNGLQRRIGEEEFIRRAREIHGEKYDYSKVKYKDAKTKVCIICPTHGEFWQSPWHHTQGNGCPKCSHPISKDEQAIYEYVCELVGKDNVIQGSRDVLNGRELDIFIPTKNIAIEYNGLYRHNSKIVEKSYHLDKLNECNKKGIKLIQIFEDEYISKQQIVLNKIAHILKCQKDLPKIMARKCLIQEIDKRTARTFLNSYHIQGFSPSTIYLGAYYNEELVGVMSFKREKKNSVDWELSRFASNYNYVCQGLGGKLFKYFLKHYEINKIKSFADRRWTIDEENNIYVQLGFEFKKYTNIEYRYYNPKEGCTRIHKFNCRKNILHRKYGLSLSMTEREMTEVLGYERIYDCGLIKYSFSKN